MEVQGGVEFFFFFFFLGEVFWGFCVFGGGVRGLGVGGGVGG